VSSWEFLGWIAVGSLSLILVSIAVLVFAGVVMQIVKPQPRRSVGRRKD
jgi:predicted phage tail protein